MQKLAVVADDFTGGNDSGGRLAGLGYRSFSSCGLDFPLEEADAVILNARSRFLRPQEARWASQQAWMKFQASAFNPLYRFQKIDSTLRGNPAQEIEGMVAATGQRFVAVVPAYPAFGRQTLGGRHYVWGKRLDKTEYFQDPLTPAKSYCVDGLFEKSWSCHVDLALVKKGPFFLKRWLGARLSRKFSYRFFTFDCVDEGDLDSIARASLAVGCRAWAGASGLAAALAKALGGRRQESFKVPFFDKMLVLVGSISQCSLEQLSFAEQEGLGPWHSLNPDDYLSAKKLKAPETKGRVILFSTVRERGQARQAQSQGARLGLGPEEVAERALKVLHALGEPFLGRRTLAVLTGGHTAEIFFAQHGFYGNWLKGELLPGLPLALAVGQGGRQQWLASKPGGFGPRDLLVKASLRALRSRQAWH